MAGIVVRPRSRILHGHDWVYASEILKVFGEPKDGDVVSLKDPKDRLLGSAIYNSRSQIVARRFSRQRQPLEADFFGRRLAQAIAYRRETLKLDSKALRLVWSESDGLPGIIVDSYGDVLVLQTLTLAMDRAKALIVEALVSLLAPRSIVERNDGTGRLAEGLEEVTGVLHGALPGEIEVEIAGLQFRIDPLAGQKTGFYLDQVASYSAVARHAAGRRVLDCFSNSGPFALACAKAGAAQVVAVDSSESAIAAGRRNEARNGLVDRVEWRVANVFDYLSGEEKRGTQWDLIVLDPPSFTKSKGGADGAMRGYKDLHVRALSMLRTGGRLATFTCSHHVGDAAFREMLGEATLDAKRAVRIVETYRQSPDHPVLLWMPETEYLRGYLLEVMPGR